MLCQVMKGCVPAGLVMSDCVAVGHVMSDCVAAGHNREQWKVEWEDRGYEDRTGIRKTGAGGQGAG